MPTPPLRPFHNFPVVMRPVALTPMPIAPAAAPVSPVVHTPALVPVVVPAVTLDPTRALRARFDALIAELHELRGQMNRAVHRSGQILIELSSEDMLTTGGVAKFDDLITSFGLPSRPTAMKYMTVAEHFTAEEAAQLGVERSYAIVRGALALPRPIAPSTLLAQNPTIRVGPDAMKLAAAPLRALLGWVAALEPRSEIPDAAAQAKRADSLRDKLQRRFVAAGIGKSTMQVRTQRGAPVVKVTLTLEQVAALLAAVRKAP